MAKARQLLAEITVADLAGLTLPRDATYNVPKGTTKMKEGKTWGIQSHATHEPGHTSPEYTAVETYVDLEREMAKDRPDPEAVLSMFLRLTAFLSR